MREANQETRKRDDGTERLADDAWTGLTNTRGSQTAASSPAPTWSMSKENGGITYGLNGDAGRAVSTLKDFLGDIRRRSKSTGKRRLARKGKSALDHSRFFVRLQIAETRRRMVIPTPPARHQSTHPFEKSRKWQK